MSENKMKEVANILGVELGEEFKIKGVKSIYKLTKGGLLVCNTYAPSKILCDLLKGEHEIEKLVLDTVEKNYLENLLRPFKDKVEFVEKREYRNKEHIFIQINRYHMYEWIVLPSFKKNSMYKGMKSEKGYTLKELGLFEND